MNEATEPPATALAFAKGNVAEISDALNFHRPAGNEVFTEVTLDIMQGLTPAFVEMRDQGLAEPSVLTLIEWMTPHGCFQAVHDPRISHESRRSVHSALERAVGFDPQQPPASQTRSVHQVFTLYRSIATGKIADS